MQEQISHTTQNSLRCSWVKIIGYILGKQSKLEVNTILEILFEVTESFLEPADPFSICGLCPNAF